ncbi:hypothetical protein CPLU01_10842 [Colletotrichum plurivorum]|uniref:Uncharacterized protein n=1 Tax=Colletotrichum plurivorum TaxID=2175906 RepID=A0A8H6K4B1_9PEZI|nr:hypothetical protein CPLU01_10842 [Colletotrichum plurivorum]
MADKSNIRFGRLLFALTPELRNIIYKYYLRVDGGYILDNTAFASGRFRLMNVDYTPVRQDLMFTCKQAGREMKGLALRHKAITFPMDHVSERAPRLCRAFRRGLLEAHIYRIAQGRIKRPGPGACGETSAYSASPGLI